LGDWLDVDLNCSNFSEVALSAAYKLDNKPCPSNSNLLYQTLPKFSSQ
jgi:hypothetical protein